MSKTGKVHLYVGDGKGKTTAAVGLCVRALGHGKRVLFCQFLKARETGELEGLRRLGAAVDRAEASEKFTFQLSEEELAHTARTHAACLQRADGFARSGDVDLIVLDEVVDALNAGVIEADKLYDLMDERARHVELVLTGRNPPERLLRRVDYHTDFCSVKHPYESGLPARKGIEY